MNGFLKSLLHRMNRNTNIIKIFSKQSKRKQRKYTIPTNHLYVLEILKKKKTWNVMKDVIGKSKIKSTNLPRKLAINKVDVYNKLGIDDVFNDFSTNIDQKLASQKPKSSKTFETHSNKVNAIIDSKPSSINELNDTFFSLKINKSSDVDDASFNIIKKCFRVLCEPLIYLFQLSLEKGGISILFKILKSDSDL